MEVGMEALTELPEDLLVDDGVCVQNDGVFQFTRYDGQTIVSNCMPQRDGTIVIQTESPDTSGVKGLDPSLLFNIPLGGDVPFTIDPTQGAYLNDLLSLNEVSAQLPQIIGVDDGEFELVHVDEFPGIINEPAETPQIVTKPPLKRGRKRKKPPDGDNNGNYFCYECSLQFESASDYLQHESTHKMQKEFVCSICSASFNFKKNLSLHEALHNVSNLQCPECDKTFNRIASYKAHLLIHEDDDSVQCDNCFEEFPLASQLKEHIEKHHKQHDESIVDMVTDAVIKTQLYACRICNRLFSNPVSLNTHKKEHEKLKTEIKAIIGKKRRRKNGKKFPNECLKCRKSFPKPSHLVRHMRVHTGEKPYICSICNTAFNQKGSLQIHMSKHNGVKPFGCSYCPLRFAQRGNLISHINKVHQVPRAGEERFNCPDCPCSFRKTATLHCHMTRFHGLKPESGKPKDAMVSDELDILQKAIRESGLPETETPGSATDGDILQEELETQNSRLVLISDNRADGSVVRYSVPQRCDGKTRWHICSTCQKEFRKPSDLIRHFRMHTREKPFRCQHCYKSFSMKSSLTAHMSTHNFKGVECRVCKKRLASMRSLQIHQRSHLGVKPYSCPICVRSFTTLGQYRVHQGTHVHRARLKATTPTSAQYFTTPEPFVQAADGQFQPRLTRRDRILCNSRTASVEERPYECDVCKLRFRKVSHLKQHSMQHTGIRPFDCNICNKRFAKGSILKMHKRTHLGIKEHVCTKCSAEFSTRGSLRRHDQTFHCEERPYMCPICQKRFKTAVTCKKHIRIHQAKGSVDSYGIQLVESDMDDTMKNECIDQNLLPEEAGTITLPHLTEENIQELEHTLNEQFFSSEVRVDAPTAEEINFAVENLNSPLEVENAENQIQDGLTTVTSMFEILPDGAASLGLKHISLAEVESLGITISDSTKDEENLVALAQQHQESILAPLQNLFCDKCDWKTDSEDLMAQHCLAHDESGQNTRPRYKRPKLPIRQFTEEETAELACQVPTRSSTESERFLIATAAEKLGKLTEKTSRKKSKFRCETCEKGFNKNSDLVRHERTHTGEKPFKCTECDRSFSVKSTLVSHKATHSVRLKLSCHVCGAFFSSRSSLKVHMRLHTGSKPFECSLCSQKFRTSGHLKNHMDSHTSMKMQRPWNPDSLPKYPIIVNTGPEKEILKDVEAYSLPIFQEKENVNTLEETRLPEFSDALVSEPDHNVVQLLSEQAEDGFMELRIADDGQLVQVFTESIEDSLSAGVTDDPVVQITTTAHFCSVCDKSFSKRSLLIRHERVHSGERPFSCDTCGQRFNQKTALDLHVKTHDGVRPHSCPHCPFDCIQKGNLLTHMSRVHQFAYHIQKDKRNVSRKKKGIMRAVSAVAAEGLTTADDKTLNMTISEVRNTDFEQVMGELFPQVT